MVNFNLDEEHLDPTAEISLDAVKQRAVRGVAVLTGRTFLLSFVSLSATAILTVFLEPHEFGVFWIVSAVVNFLAYFSDIGLAAALIQNKGKLTKTSLNTTFIVQQSLVLSLLLILFLSTPAIQKYYSLTSEGKLLIYALGASLLLSSLKTIPSVLLERGLEFEKLVLPQVLESLFYNVVAVFLAWKGFGIRSFTYAVLARGLVGFAAIYLLKPWLPGMDFSRKALKKLLTFGLPYQANTLLATVKDDGMTAFLGGIVGTTGLGYLGWAQKWAQYPLRLFMDHVLKVTFPAFSRMQDKRKHLENAVTRSIFFVCFLVFPSVVGLVITAPVLVKIIPRYEKWEPALIPLTLISINTLFAASTTNLTNLLNAIGKIKTTFKLMVMWTVLSWILIPHLARVYGVNGAALGYAIVGLSSVIAIRIVYGIVKFSLFKSVLIPAIASAIMASFLLILRIILPVRLSSVFFIAVFGSSIYLIAMYVLAGKAIFNDAKKGIKAVFNR